LSSEVRVVEARVERVWTPRVDVDEVAADDAAAAGRHEVEELNAWLIGDDDEVIVIDPGEDAASVLEQVGERDILAVICTHGHPAHIAAAAEVAARDEAPVALHPGDLALWRNLHEGDDPEIEMADGGRFEVADARLEVIATRGHTRGSVSLYCADLDVVFTGDALSARGPVPHEGAFVDFLRQLTAIGDRLLDLPPGTRVLSGHGEESTIADAAKRFEGWLTAGPDGVLAGGELPPDEVG
jgi:glyoxylase-like metal-dependent hydrolase (beta-lactamase superfamily II)